MTPLQYPSALVSCLTRGSFGSLSTYINTEDSLDLDLAVCDPIYALVTKLDYFRLDAK